MLRLPLDQAMELAEERPHRTPGRRWSWVALVAAVVLCVAELPTWGLAIVLAPLTFALSVVAWRRSPHDGVFWIGFTLNALLLLSFVGFVIAILIGEIAIGRDDSPDASATLRRMWTK